MDQVRLLGLGFEGYLDNVAQGSVGLCVGSLHLLPLLPQPQRQRLQPTSTLTKLACLGRKSVADVVKQTKDAQTVCSWVWDAAQPCNA